MPSLTLKDVPEELLERLRERARAERRSLSAQAIVELEATLGRRDYRTPEERAEVARRWADIGKRAEGVFDDLDVEEIYEARTLGREVDL